MELIKPAKSFLRRAGTIIVAIMIVLWFLSTFPHAPIGATLPAIDYSFVGKIGHYLEFIFLPIGFNWQIVAALIPGMAAREIAVSALGTIYAISKAKSNFIFAALMVFSYSIIINYMVYFCSAVYLNFSCSKAGDKLV
jgi:ferrous iron transport protein B